MPGNCMPKEVFEVFDCEQRENPPFDGPRCPRMMARYGCRTSLTLCQFPRTRVMLGFTKNCMAACPCPVTELYMLENGDGEALRLYELHRQMLECFRPDEPTFGERMAEACECLRPTPIPPPTK